MTFKVKFSGFAIALAWPQTYCKEPGAWYDQVTGWLGINKNNYYKAGHAALVLIDGEAEKCHYFDFGRYHAPFQHGRVRSMETDHDLEMKTIPRISEDGKYILNFREILTELQHNPAYHGEGTLHASYCKVDFYASYSKALQMQEASPIPYGPFIRSGSNCCRFVNTVILAGNPKWLYRVRLKYFIPFTPTPLRNVYSLPDSVVMQVLRKTIPFTPLRPLSRDELLSTLSPPERHPDIPENAQWLSGEGAGSWFVLDFEHGLVKVTRYNPDGKLECHGIFEGSDGQKLRPEDSFGIGYPSNCREITLSNGKGNLQLSRVDND